MTHIHFNGVDREMTAAEEKAHQTIIKDNATQETADNTARETYLAAKLSAHKKLAALGLTAAEIAAF